MANDTAQSDRSGLGSGETRSASACVLTDPPTGSSHRGLGEIATIMQASNVSIEDLRAAPATLRDTVKDQTHLIRARDT